jgi:hypothetical protein
VERRFSDNELHKHILHEKLAEMYKKHGESRSEYDMILFFICQWLGLGDIYPAARGT